jgi:hypothetical protein
MLCNGKLLCSQQETQQETRPHVSGFLFDVIMALCVIEITIAQWKEGLIVIVFGWHFRRSTWNVCAQHNINIFFSLALCSYWSTKCIMLFWKMNEWESLNSLIVCLNVAWDLFLYIKFPVVGIESICVLKHDDLCLLKINNLMF